MRFLEGIDNAQKIRGVVVANNIISRPYYNGLYAHFCDDLAVDVLHVKDVRNAASADGNAVRVNGAAITDNNNIVLNGVMCNGSARHGIRIEHATGVVVSGASLRNSGSGTQTSVILLTMCNDAEVAGGIIDGSNLSGASVGVIHADRVSNFRVRGARIMGHNSATTQDGIRLFNGSGTNSVAIFNGLQISGCGRHGIYTTNSDRVIVTGSDVRDVVNATKINISGATTSVNADNIT
jgi:hypothetical protein